MLKLVREVMRNVFPANKVVLKGSGERIIRKTLFVSSPKRSVPVKQAQGDLPACSVPVAVERRHFL